MRYFSAEYVFPVSSEPLRNGVVVTDDEGTVQRVCDKTSLDPSETEQLVELDGVIVPGFVNSHCHIELSHLKGAFTKGSGMSGFINQINALRDSVDRAGRLAAIEREMNNLYEQGVSAMADISNCDESFQAKAASPMYTRTFIELFGTDPNESDALVEGALKLSEKAASMGIDAAPTPHSCYTMCAELLQKSAQAGLERGFISYHSQESAQEEDMIMFGKGELYDNYRGRNLPVPEVTGKPALVYFVDKLLGFSGSAVKGNILLVHNVVVNQQSIDYALKHLESPYWAICPLSNIFIHNQLPPLDLMRSNALKITIGTDSLSSNDSLSMVDEMLTVQKHFPHIPFAEILRWATLNGAEFLKRDTVLGSLDPGKRPGIVHISDFDTDHMCLRPSSESIRLI